MIFGLGIGQNTRALLGRFHFVHIEASQMIWTTTRNSGCEKPAQCILFLLFFSLPSYTIMSAKLHRDKREKKAIPANNIKHLREQMTGEWGNEYCWSAGLGLPANASTTTLLWWVCMFMDHWSCWNMKRFIWLLFICIPFVLCRCLAKSMAWILPSLKLV